MHYWFLRSILILMVLLHLAAHVSPGQMPSASPPRTPPTFSPQRFVRIGLEQGLPQNTVEAIVQDALGFIWFGTQDGICRYDGYSFRIFRADIKDSSALQSASIGTMFVDKRGTLWVGTEGGGLSRFDAVRERFTTYRHDPNDTRSLADDTIEALYEDHTGVLWVGTETGGLCRLDDAQRGTFTTFRHDPADTRSISSNRVYSITQDQNHVFWIGTFGGGLNKFVPQTGECTRFLYDPTNVASLSNNFIYQVLPDADGMLWIATYGGGLNRFQPGRTRFGGNGTFTRFQHNTNTTVNSLSNDRLRAITFDRSGRLWMSTDGSGVDMLDVETRQFQNYRYVPGENGTISGNFGRALFCDASGIIWIGTNVGGVCYKAAKKFMLFRRAGNNPHTLSNDIVRALHEGNDGTLWIGTNDGGLNAMNRATGEFRSWKHDSLNPKSLSNNAVWSIVGAGEGKLWVGTHDGLNLFDTRTGEARVLRSGLNDSLSNVPNIIRALLPARYSARGGIENDNDMMWIGLVQNAGLLRYDPLTKRSVRYLNNPANPRSLGSNYIRSLCRRRDGSVWVGTWNGGLCKFDAARGDFTVFKTDPANPRTIRSNVVRSLHEDRQGILWVGTPEGLYRLDDEARGTFTLFNEADGLPNNVIYGIEDDTAGNLWISTNKGLTRFNPRTKQCRNYSVSDGLQSNEFNGTASCTTRDGMMYFGGVAGFNGFHPDSVRDNAHVPPVMLTALSIFNKPVQLDTAIELAHSIQLRHDDNITIEFTALDYAASQQNRFMYLMEGFDHQWTELGTKHEATYTALPPGTYTFRVRASNADGVWNMTGRSLRVVVVPPWWMTWWFRSVAVLAFAGLLVGAVRWRVAYLHRRADVLQCTVQEQTQELRGANKEITRQLQILDEQSRSIEITNTTLQAQNEELAALNTEKNELMGIVAHDLKNPIGAISGLADLLHSGFADAGQVPQVSEQIIHTADRMLELVKNLLDVNRLESGAMQFHTVAFDVTPMVESAVWQYQVLATAKRITLRFAAFAPSNIIVADEQAVMQVLDNILSNAVKYSPHGRDVFVQVVQNAQTVSIHVQDQGPGISAEDMTKLFGKFARLSAQPTGGENSTGLGLSIVKKMVEAMNERVWCELELGNGATFVVELPRSSRVKLWNRIVRNECRESYI
jgi:signal transduction histidine kinase/ligand-binding sensor domain-containing protein